jgi:hypothetical protein
MATRNVRLKFWYWAHDAAERLWHWIYYNKLPDGQKTARAITDRVNHVYSAHWVNSRGEKVDHEGTR